MDCCKFTEEVTSTAAAVPDVVSLLEQISTSAGTWCAAINQANAFFSNPVNKDMMVAKEKSTTPNKQTNK